MDRRRFLLSAVGTSAFGILGIQAGCSGTTGETILGNVTGGYGPLGEADANGVLLPDGFSSRIIATSGEAVANTDYEWHPDPDGGATFSTDDGGWVYVSNQESDDGSGGASMVRFDTDGEIIAAGSILAGTTRNCAGGRTPWGTWLSCEETGKGLVWECHPTGANPAVPRPAMGRFSHEAAAANPARQEIYLTEDRSDGGLYRFRPDTWGELGRGVLEVMVDVDDGVGWAPIPDPEAADDDTRTQVATMRKFDGGEGAWFDGRLLHFSTKGDNRIWTYDPDVNDLNVLYDVATATNPVLSGVDNLVVSDAGQLFVCEDGGNMEVVLVEPDGTTAPFLRIPIGDSELAGAAFDPAGERLYVSSQRNPGTTYEITGPFRTVPEPTLIPVAAVETQVETVVGEGRYWIVNNRRGGYLNGETGSITVERAAEPVVGTVWEFEPDAEGAYRLVNVPSGRYLSIRDEEVVTVKRAGPASLWNVVPFEQGHLIVNLSTGRNLDADKDDSNARVDTTSEESSDAVWRLTEA